MAGEAIKFKASIDTTDFSSGAKNLQNIAAQASAGIAQHFGKIAAAVVGIGAAFIGVRAAVQAFNAAIDMGGKLNDLAARTGETAGNLAILQRAFQNAGAGADSVGPTINRLQRAIVEAGEGGKEQAEAFQKLGVNLSDLKNLTPTEQLQAVAKALQGVGNDSDRGAIAMQLLGRSGGELLPLLRAMSTELDVARGQLGGLPGVMDRANQAFDTIGDNLGAIAAKSTEFAAGLLEKVAPGLADLTTRLANIDAAGFGAKLSEYFEKTVAWITETFKLKDALNQVEVAIKGVTSGVFGDSLKLMFLTARDTAMNAINQIVAAGLAALQTIGGALVELFSPSSTTMSFIAGAFNMLGGKIASGIFDAIAGILENIPMMGAAAQAVRAAQAEAEQSIKDISNIMYYEADNLKKEWASVGKAMPEGFAAAYKANLENPLFEMKDRTAETAAQMEKVAAATRAAAFDAEKFGNALAEARLDRFTGDVPSSPFPSTTRGGGVGLSNFVQEPEKKEKTAKPEKEMSAMERLRAAAAEFDEAAMAEEARIMARRSPGEQRAADLEAAGQYRSAAAIRAREERRAQEEAARFEESQARRARQKELEAMSPIERAKAQSEDRKLAREQERMAREQSKTEKERERDARQAESGPGGSRTTPQTDKPATEGTLKEILKKVQERPILVA